MSGHSKWSTIKRQKGVADTKRGQVFTKLGNAVTIAVREGGGGDPASNFKLRLAMDQAKAANMPKDNVNRAIERGLGKGGGGQLESVTYEGYGPGKVALMIEAVTDNKNRTTPEVRGTIERSGGTFASPGAVAWMFAEVGAITVSKGKNTFDKVFDIAVEAGAEDVEDADASVIVYTKPANLESVKKALVDQGLIVERSEVSKKASTTVPIKDSDSAKKVLNLMEKLEDLDDVQKVYANFDIPEEVLT